MKKLKTLLTLAMVALMSLSFTSCDEDANTAYYLDGTWRGNMYVNSSYNGVTYTSTYSVITFNAGYDSGNGYWVDYYNNGHYGNRNYVANHIYWKVRDGNIYIHFVEEGNDVVIYNYGLNDRYFSGEVDAGHSVASFRLTKDYYDDWSDLDYGYWGYSSISCNSPIVVDTRAAEGKDSTQYVRWFDKEDK